MADILSQEEIILLIFIFIATQILQDLYLIATQEHAKVCVKKTAKYVLTSEDVKVANKDLTW